MEELRREFERLRKKMLQKIDGMLSEFASLRADWTPDGALKPLYTIYEFPDRYVILVDVAAADTSSVNVIATEDMITVEARLEKEISLGDIYGTIAGHGVSVRYYRHEIPLPPDAEPKGMRVRVRPDKIIEIVLPRKPGAAAGMK